MANPRLVVLLAALIATPSGIAATCESLASLTLPDTTITLARSVAAGAFSLPGMPPAAQAGFKRLPAFCRVAASIHPTADSDIKIEVWLPADNWNGKFMGVGNGGWSGAISYPSLGTAVNHGYAVASTNTGHDGSEAGFALGHPEKLVDFAWRAVHEMTVKGKAIEQAFYTKAPEHSYWNGCSSGGKQGLKEAQKFPQDYDGIIAGAPAYDWTHLMAGDLWPAVATMKDPAAYLTPAKLQVLHQAAMQACDSLDGLKDGLIEDPTRCHFDPATVLCKGSATEDCLTAPQVEAARKIYGGAKNPRTGKPIFPGMTPGSELVWGALASGPKPFGVPDQYFKYIIHKDADWDFKTIDFDKDVVAADKIDKGLINATEPNLKGFFSRGGKIFIYHGWNDQLIAPASSVNYYKSVVKAMGGVGKVDGSFRLFMAPGMNHCGGGDGPSRIDVFQTLEQWVEHGKAPEQIIAGHVDGAGKVDRTRPLCVYPKVARYKGTGSIDNADSFVCAAPSGAAN